MARCECRIILGIRGDMDTLLKPSKPEGFSTSCMPFYSVGGQGILLICTFTKWFQRAVFFVVASCKNTQTVYSFCGVSFLWICE
jgi:hypothetical protein